MLQSESLSTILGGGVQDAIAKNVSVVWGMEGAQQEVPPCRLVTL